MAAQHRIEVFTEGSSYEGAIAYAHELAASRDECELRGWDVRDSEGSARMKSLGIMDIPAIAVDSEPLTCCGPTGEEMRG